MYELFPYKELFENNDYRQNDPLNQHSNAPGSNGKSAAKPQDDDDDSNDNDDSNDDSYDDDDDEEEEEKELEKVKWSRAYTYLKSLNWEERLLQWMKESRDPQRQGNMHASAKDR